VGIRNRLIALLLLLGLGGGYIAYVELASNGPGAGNGKYAKPAAGKNGKGGPPVPVTVGRVRVQDVVRRVEAVGRGQASETVTLKARIDGQVAEVPFSEGRHVRRGDLLVRLDPADHQARLKLAEANLARGQAAQAKARADLGRYVELRSSGFVSEEKVLELRAVLEAAEAQVKADLAAVDLARLQLG
jgi:multidrug efflux system membrane fusion protein